MQDKKFVITVQRQFGSRGKLIAGRLAELLNLPFHDKDLQEAAAEKLNLPVEVIAEEEEYTPSSKVSDPNLSMAFPQNRGVSDLQKKIFYAQKEAILELAGKESCVIVGRCSDFILQNIECGMHIYIYAPFMQRISYIVRERKLDVERAKNMIVEADRVRNAYHMNFAGYLPFEPSGKDLLINASMFGVEGTANLLADAAHRKMEQLWK